MGVVIALAQLAPLIASDRRAGKRVVFTNGCFDLLHLGHITYLQHARALGDLLVVGVNSDASTRRLKGPRRPLTPEDERAATLAALACVDYVTIFADDTASQLVAALQPAIYAKGADYAGADAGASTAYTLDADELRRILVGQPNAHPQLTGLGQRLPEARIVAEYGGSVALLPYLPGHSTTALIERILSRFRAPDDA